MNLKITKVAAIIVAAGDKILLSPPLRKGDKRKVENDKIQD
jgi:hypothetical protein